MEKKIILGKRRNEYGKRIRKDYEQHRLHAERVQSADLVLLRDGYSNTITTFLKDNFVCVIRKE